MVGGVAAARHEAALAAPDSAGDRRQLLYGAVFVALALERQGRRGDGGELSADVPALEFGRKPGLVPGAKDRLGLVAVVALEEPLERTGPGRRDRRAHALAREVVIEDVRRFRDYAGDPPGKRAGKKQGDR